MSNWEKISSDEMKIGLKIANLKKGKLQIKYAKDIVAKDKEIERLHSIIKEARDYINKGAYNCDGSYILEILDKVKEK